jgi:hypothetical protein
MVAELLKRIDDDFRRFPRSRGGEVAPHEFDTRIAMRGFPVDPDYREFVLLHGGGYIGHLPIFGLRSGSGMPSVAGASTAPEVTEGFRKLGWLEVDGWLVISADQGGNPIGLSHDGKIRVADATETSSVIELASSFADFVKRECLRLSDRQ